MSDDAINSLSERWREAVGRARKAYQALEDAYEEVREAFDDLEAIRDRVEEARRDVLPQLRALKFPAEAGYHHLRDLSALIGRAGQIELPDEY